MSKAHFPLPDLVTCSVGATCDDMAVITQRLAALGFDIFWWEMPHRRPPDPGEPAVTLPGGFSAPQSQVDLVRTELDRVRQALQSLTGQTLSDRRLAEGIGRANRVRSVLADLRELAYTARRCPMPALEMLIAEMLAIHFCSDQAEALGVLEELLAETRTRVQAGAGVLEESAVRVFWVNPVADLRVMNLLEDAGGRICGTEYLFCHALDPIPEDLPPMEALARMALADPMVGSPVDRARRIAADVRRFGAEAVVISRIPGASHCALEGRLIGEIVGRQCGVPVLEVEVPPISDALEPALPHAAGGPGGNGETKGSRHTPCAVCYFETGSRSLILSADARRADNHDLCRIDAGSRTLKIVLVDRRSPCSVAAGVVDQGIDQDRLALDLLEKLLHKQGLRRADLARGGCHRIRSQTRAHGRHDHHRDHLPGPRRPPSRAGCPDHRRHRRSGQQARAIEGGRRRGRLRHERPLCGRHGAFSGDAGRPTGPPFTSWNRSSPAAARRPSSAACASYLPRARLSGSWPRACCRRTSSRACKRRLPRGLPP